MTRSKCKGRIFLAAAVSAALLALLATGCRRDQFPENAVRVVVFDRGTDGGRTNPASNRWTDWIRERVREDLGLEVIFETVPRADEEQAQATLLAAGNPPDLMMTWNSTNVIAWGELGGLFDMAPYIDAYLSDAREFLGPDPALPGRDFILRNQNQRTGQLFSVPMRRANTARLNVFMRHDWLDALGLPVPTTHEEFFAALAAFRDYNPGGVDGVIPWIMNRDVRWQAGRILESFIEPDLSLQERWAYIVADRHLMLPGYVEGVRFLNRMYNAGLVYRDFFLHADDTMLNNRIASGRVGAFGHNWDQIFRESEGLITNLRQIVPEARWVALDAFPSSDGVARKISYDAAGLSVFIPSRAANPRGAMQYLNWLARFENFHFLQTGPEGIVHEIVDGLPRINPTAGDGWIQNSPWNIDLTPLHNGIFLRTPEETVRALALGYPFPAEDVIQAHNAAMLNALADPVIMTAAPLVAAGPMGPVLHAQAEALLSSAVRAPEEAFDSIWNSGIANFLNANARAIIEERMENFVPPAP